ncbi:MAG TPA: hypothetical protein VII95_06590 [Terriglobales bacterium]|jgi:hypothetical protein
MSAKQKTGLAIFIVIVAGIAALGWYTFGSYRNSQQCGYCERPLQDRLRVVAEIDGKRRDVCCPQCAVSEARQEHKPVRLIGVRDYSTAKVIDPAQAYYVNDSRAIACTHPAMRMDDMKHTEPTAFDRCSPGAFAFAKKEDAEDFVAANGGQILRLEQLLAEASHD